VAARALETRRARREARRFYLFVAPWLIGFVLFQAGPIAVAVGLSLTDWLFNASPEWRGLAHYRELAGDRLFWRALLNTVYYTALSVPLGIAAAFGLALLMNQRWTGMGIFRTIFFTPALVSGVALAIVWGWLFNPRLGAVNSLLGLLGLPQPGWLTDPGWAMPTIIILSLWGIGGTIYIFIAGLRNIPPELYDAARLDGAGRLAATRQVTMPMVSSITFFLLIISGINAMQLFTPTYILTEGGPENSTLTLPLYIYQNAFRYQEFGYAAALTVVLIALTLLLTIVQLVLARRWVYYAGWDGRS
jgi:multiple sugar transport system permease protein